MRGNKSIFLFIILVFIFSGLYSQTTTKKFVSVIADKDTFDISKPINEELIIYFSDPNNYKNGMHFYFTKGLNNCVKEVPAKEYWYADKEHSYYF
jgi:hypothetical protein